MYKTKRFLGIDIDPEREITVSCGSTEAMIDVLLAVINPGDEVDRLRAVLRKLRSRRHHFRRYAALRSASTARTGRSTKRNSPPLSTTRRKPSLSIRRTTRPERSSAARNSQIIADLCQKWDVLAITDEIYEHIIYDGAKHVSPITLDGMRERTIVVNGMSKTYSVTGWRVGYIIAPPGITGAIRKMHDFVTVGAPAPLQEAGAVALRLPDSYYIGSCRSLSAAPRSA